MRTYKCECCGGDINRATMRCEYCGTQYKEDYNDSIIRVETYHNPVDHYTAMIKFDSDQVDCLGAERVSEIAMHELTHKLADCIAQNMVMTHRYEPSSQLHYIRGDIKVIRPIEGADRWRFDNERIY